jgi:threonine dehydratase
MTATSLEPALITLRELDEAATTLRGVAVRTPLLPDDTLSALFGADIRVKPEMLQRGGALKLRGAYNFIAKLAPDERARGVIAPSSGNHAQAVALAAKIFGVKATVVMPETVTAPKRGGAERLGAKIVLAGTTTQHRMDRALEIARDEGGVLVPPYDHPWIIAGQGTAGLEIAEDLPGVKTVLVQVGGGGLSAGVATAIKLRCPGARVIGIEPEGAPKLSRAWTAGQPTRLERSSSIADGLMAVEIGATPFAHHRAYIDDVVTVPDTALREAVRHLLDRMKLVAEPSGAITIAALLQKLVVPTGPTVAILSGGNIEWDGLSALLGG